MQQTHVTENGDVSQPEDHRPASTSDGLDLEESESTRLERLGRQRPGQFTSLWQEAGFVFSITMSQLLTEYFVSGFTVLIPIVAQDLSIPPSSTTWPASAFSLVISAFLLPFGRLADIYGGFSVYMFGIIWCCVWSLIAGFSQNELMLDFCRALQGLGPAAYLPAGLTLIGQAYRPGPRKNLVFSIYGAMAPLGLFVGVCFAGVTGEYTGWRWYFWIGTILTFVAVVISWFTVPSDYASHKLNGVKMDWLGSSTTSAGIILLVFAITDSSHAPDGWATAYIYVTFTLGIILLGIAIYIEGWVAEQPLLPAAVFKIKYMVPFIIGLLFAYGTLGIYLLYATLYIENILNIAPLLLVAWFIPLGLGGVVLSITGGLILHKVPGTILLYVTCIAIILASLLLAIMPTAAIYWAYVFPAMIFATIAIDLVFNVANIFFSTQLLSHQQGLAGALANVLLQLSIALLLGFADIVVTKTSYQGLKQSYRNAFWFELACGSMALVIFAAFVRIPSAVSGMTADERAVKREGEQPEDVHGPSLQIEREAENFRNLQG
nr:putative mfs-type transporter [Quercus suber]